jgi:peptidoglycan/LPS O-acetylase OafA/YrhL
MMRMRRIYPALAVAVAATVVIGWFVTLPGEYLKHLLQALSALAFVSNFVFNSDSGYFAMAAQTKPLLHHLVAFAGVAVLYLDAFDCMAGVAVGVPRHVRDPRRDKLRCRSSRALSLAWCLWASQHDAMGSSFFSLRARAWEPLAGGLIAAAEIRRRTEGAKASWLESPLIALAGWVLVAGCTVYPLPEAGWPGMLTILPILGAALVVAARQGQARAVCSDCLRSSASATGPIRFTCGIGRSGCSP